jgi:hypothetical protein
MIATANCASMSYGATRGDAKVAEVRNNYRCTTSADAVISAKTQPKT